jgi:hypothetical protein
MTVDEIRSWKEAEPFRRFLLVLANGEELLVPRRGSLAFDPDGRFVVYPFPDRGGHRIVPAKDISSIRAAEGHAA